MSGSAAFTGALGYGNALSAKRMYSQTRLVSHGGRGLALSSASNRAHRHVEKLNRFSLGRMERVRPGQTQRVPALELDTERVAEASLHPEEADRGAPLASSPGLLAGKRVVVVGGGPAGMLAAMRLAQRGAGVDVYETREFDYDPGTTTWFILLQERGLRALEAAGIDVSSDPSMRFGGVSVARPDGTAQVNAALNRKRSLCGNRAMHTKFVQQQALQLCGDNITIHHGCKMLGGDLAAKTLRFREVQSGREFEVQADLIVGADGARSTVRRLMLEQVSGFSVNTQPNYSAVQSFALPRLPSAEDLNSLGKPFQLFADAKPGEEWFRDGNVATFCLPKPGAPCFVVFNTYTTGTVMGSLVMSQRHWDKQYSEEEARALVVNSLPQLPPFVVDIIAKTLSSSPKPRVGPTSVKCNKIAVPGVLLVGDAAHAVTPAMGQGANSALEDSVIIDRAVEQAGGDIEGTCRLFNELRLEDAHALVDLDRAALFMTPRTPGFVLFKLLRASPLLANQVMSALTAKLPEFLRVPSYSLSMLTKTERYAEVRSWCLRSVGILAVLALCGLSAIALLLSNSIPFLVAAVGRLVSV